MKVTAETITDEQIRALAQEAFLSKEWPLVYACSDALRRGVARIAKERKAARAVVADTWNARHGDNP